MPKRRENGEGTVTQRQDGRWQAAYWVTLDDGTRKRRYVYASDREGAREKLRAALAAVDRGDVPTDRRAGQATVGWWLDQWLAVKRGEVAGTTWREYERTVRRHLRPALGSLRLTALKPTHVRRLLGEKRAEGLSDQSRRHIYNRLHTALADAVADGLLVRNVTEQVEPPRPRRGQPETFSPVELRAILEEAAAHQPAGDGLCLCRGSGCRQRIYFRLFVLALQSGLRIGELQALRWEDVDLEQARLWVRRNRRRDGEMAEPKSEAGRRMVPIPGAVELLREQRAAQLRERMAAPTWSVDGLVFTLEGGRPLSYHRALRVFHQTQERAGIPPDRRRGLHALRKAYGTTLVAEGVPVSATQRMMGHSKSELTLAYYVATDEAMLEAAAGRAAAAFDELVPETGIE